MGQKKTKLFSAEGIKYLALELFIVFLGVYLAFLFQSYNENRKIRTEQQLILKDNNAREMKDRDSLLYRNMIKQYSPHFSENDIEALFN